MSVLVDHQIEELVKTHKLIERFDKRSLEGASYDMRLGSRYIRGGSFGTLTDDKPGIILRPGQFAILQSLEELNMPNDLIGHNGIMSAWAKRGLVSLFSPQIDPGFSGVLWVPIFNAGDMQVTLTLGDKIFTVEFVRTEKPASYSWTDRYGRQNRIAMPVSPSESRPDLSDVAFLQKDLQEVREKLAHLGEQQTSLSAEVSTLKQVFSVVREMHTVGLSKKSLIIALIALAVAFISADPLRRLISQLFVQVFGSTTQPSK